MDRDVELLPGGGGEPQEADLEAVLHYVLVLGPHYLGQLLQITKLKSRNPGKKVKYSLKMVCDKLLRFSRDLCKCWDVKLDWRLILHNELNNISNSDCKLSEL